MHQTGIDGTGFVFRKRSEHIDWRKLASVDISQISRELDFRTLQDNIINVAFCNIEVELDLSNVDLNFVKLFKLAQLTIEYLLHSQDYLSGLVKKLEDSLKDVNQENKRLKKELVSEKELVTKVKKENRRRRLMLESHQKQQEVINEEMSHYYKCSFCSKMFVNASFLESHIDRRHSQNRTSNDTKYLEKELFDVKERCLKTEMKLEEHSSMKNVSVKERIEESIKKEMESWRNEIIETNKINSDQSKLEEVLRKEIESLKLDQKNKQNQSEANFENILREKMELLQSSQMQESLSRSAKTSEALLHEIESRVKKQIQNYKSLIEKQLHQQIEKYQKELCDLKLKEILTKERMQNVRADIYDGRSMTVVKSKLPHKVTKVNTEKKKKIETVRKLPVQSSSSSSDEDDSYDAVVQEKLVTKHTDVRNDKYNTECVRTKAAVEKNPKLLDMLRDEICGLLHDKLYELGVPDNAKSLSNAAINNKLTLLEVNRKHCIQKFEAFNEIRDQRKKEVEDKIRLKGMKEYLWSKDSPTKIKGKVSDAALSSHKNSPILVKSNRKNEEPFAASPLRIVGEKRDDHGRHEITPTPKPRHISSPKLTSTARISSSSSSDSLGISNSDLSDVQKIQSDIEAKKVNLVSSTDDSEDEEDSNWDSISDIEALPDDQDSVVKIKKSTAGSNVAKLTESIERQLSARKEKPIGGVDLNDIKQPYSMSRKIVSDDFDDDLSSLSITDDISEGVVKNSLQSSVKSGSEATSVWASSAS